MSPPLLEKHFIMTLPFFVLQHQNPNVLTSSYKIVISYGNSNSVPAVLSFNFPAAFLQCIIEYINTGCPVYRRDKIRCLLPDFSRLRLYSHVCPRLLRGVLGHAPPENVQNSDAQVG